jgi:UDP-glucose 4-epimerase
MKVLITGGAGYLGSIIGTALEDRGHSPIILDSLYRGPRAFVLGRPFYHCDVGDPEGLRRLFHDHPEIRCTIHCAGLISVPESVSEPLRYWRENLTKSLALFENLLEMGQSRVVLSSTAAVYAAPPTFEVREDDLIDPRSPYAATKRAVEMAIADLTTGTGMQAIVLRYFNPVGSDPAFRSGIYERIPTHVLGQLVAAATGAIDSFTLTGVDLPTRDGTGVRDYIHAWDLARAHVQAVERFDQVLDGAEASHVIMNVGTGRGTTVRELVGAFERVFGRPVPVREGPARPGDAIGAFANVDRAAHLMGWTAQLGLDAAIASALEWERRRRSVLGFT